MIITTSEPIQGDDQGPWFKDAQSLTERKFDNMLRFLSSLTSIG